MTEFVIQYKDEKGNKLYPVTLTTAVVNNSGENLDVILNKVGKDIEALIKANETNSSSLHYIEKSLQLLEKSVNLLDDSIQNMDIKVDVLEGKVLAVEESNKHTLERVEEFQSRFLEVETNVASSLLVVEKFESRVGTLETEIEKLNADVNTEGSVYNKINSALSWSTL